MFGWFKRKKDINSHLHGYRKVTVKGIDFVIKKIRPIDHMSGNKVLLQFFDTYKTKKEMTVADVDESSLRRVRDHMADVLLCGVVSPKLKRKETDEGVLLVEDLFIDWDLAQELYGEIYNYTLGKKKVKQLSRSLQTSSAMST